MTRNDDHDLVALLERRAAEQAQQLGFTFLADGETSESNLSFGELLQRARAIAALLQAHTPVGSRVLLLYPPGLDYISAFFGCLVGGYVAVPAYPPGPSRLHRTLRRLETIVADADADIVLTTNTRLGKLGMLSAVAPRLARARWLATDMLDAPPAGAWRRPELNKDSLALLQYTSGSTGTPKGVMLTHANLLANEQMIQRTFRLSHESIGVGWLPLYHDMGLIGYLLQPVYTGFRCVLMSPLDFIARPMRWLEAISRYGGTTAGGPNFAYELCVSKSTPEAREQLDLRSWTLAFTGAEPVRSATLDRFTKAFAPSGFRRSAFLPCYGLAEASLLVSAKPAMIDYEVARIKPRALEQGRAEPTSENTGATELVSNGLAVDGCTAIIVDPVKRIALAEREVGEIWVAGPHVGLGYWGDREQSRQTFEATIADDSDGRRFLRTGDLGFQLNGEIFINARLKDLIIVRGRNFYPQDIESVAEDAHPSLRRGCSAAFSVDVNDEERLVVAAELDPRSARMPSRVSEAGQAIRRALADHFDVHVHGIILLKAGSLPKTSSGKVQRHACRTEFLQQTLDIIGTDIMTDGPEPATGLAAADVMALPPDERHARVREHIRSEIARVARVPVSQVDPSLAAHVFGIDSLMAMQLANSLERDLGATLSPAPFLNGESISLLAAQLLAAMQPLQDAAAAEVPAPASDTGDAFALSAGQEALWFMHQLVPESPAHTVATALHVRGELSELALENALRALLGRHPALHTTYEVAAGKTSQRWRKTLIQSFSLERHDVSSSGEDALLRAVVEFVGRPFDLARGPVFRAALFAVSGNEFVLALAAHHIATDLWSIVTLLGELNEAYHAACAGRAMPAATDAGYRQFVEWQQRYLACESDRDWSYWKDQIAEVPPLDLPTDRPRPPTPSFRGSAVPLSLAPLLVQRVNELARDAGVTPFVVLLAAYQALLGRFAGQQSFLVGAPLAGRPQARYEQTIGYFVNPLPLRANLEGEPTFRMLLQRVRDVVLGALEHQRFPLANAAQRSEQAGDPSRPGLFQCVFAFDKAHVEEQSAMMRIVIGERGSADFAGLEVSAFEVGRTGTHFDLTLRLSDGAAMDGALIFNTDIFDRSTIEQLARSFEALLQDAVADPQRPIAELAIAATSDIAAQAELAQGALSLLPNLSVSELVAGHSRTAPDRIAVTDRHGSISYGDLDRAANQLANRLRALGIGSGAYVGAILERGVELAVAALGILKAGAAYIPIDPDYPTERIGYMLHDSGAQAVVVGSHRGHPLSETIDVAMLSPADWAQSTDVPPQVRLHPSSAAYCIYTSGSTGRPKGVVVGHRELLNLVHWHQRQFDVTDRDRATLVASPSFDASVWEMWPYLTCGARLLAPDDATIKEPHELSAWLAREQITISFLPTPLAELALPSLATTPSSLRYVLTGGQQLTNRPATTCKFELINCYGPTEGTVVTTFAGISAGDSGRTPPIGRPIDNTRVYVLDAAMQPVPPGARGELYIGGASVARGYHARRALTAERFCPDPFDSQPGSRMYRTGDVVRWRAGQLDYLGRVDDQVKIRGFRIEIGEIETALREQPGVRDVAVVARQQSAGGPRLVAHVVLVPGIRLAALRDALSRRLPAFMVPSDLMTLDALPLTSNGKIDQQALQALPLPASTNYRAPRDDLEATLAALWEDVLGVERVGIDHNFFALGGHSLLATLLTSRVRTALGADLALRELFEAPTVAGIAVRLRGRVGLSQPPLTRRAAILPPLSFAQERLWFLDRMEPGSTTYNVSGAIRLVGTLDLGALARSLTEVVQRHEILRTTFADEMGAPVARVHASLSVTLPLLDLCSATDIERAARVRSLLSEEASKGFDLSRGPLLRGCLAKTGTEEHLLVFTMHHIVCDGWSLGVLIREITTLYACYVRGLPSPLADLPIQYADFAAWQRDQLRGARLDAQIDYWTDALADTPLVLDMPTDRPRPPVRTFRGATLVRPLPTKLRRLVADFARTQNATPFMTLFAAFGALLARYTGEQKLIVGTPVAYRSQQQTEDLLGLFVNTLALALHVDGGNSFHALVANVKAQLLGAHAHQDLPFERLVEVLGVERDMSRTPLVQVMCSMQNAVMDAFELPGIEATLLPSDTDVAKFDLTLTIEDGREGHELQWEYSTDLFDRSTIERMAAHFEALLEAALLDPVRPLALLSMTGEARSMLAGHLVASQGDTTLLDLFEAQVAASENATAVVHDTGQWSYAELNRRAEAVAAALRDAGVTPGARVAVLMRRSAYAISATLGVLKAGAAYVPIDPEAGDERIHFVLDDCGARVALSEEARQLPGIFWIDARVAAEREVTAPASVRRSPRFAAYVIYTSGSTGTPKGVVVEHASAIDYVRAFGRMLKITAADRLLQFTSPGFDVSVEEVFGTLAHGATLVLRTDAMLETLQDFVDACDSHRITILDLPTAYWSELTFGLEGGLRLPPATRAVVIGGEQASRDALARWHRSVPAQVRLINAYGPTETTIASTWAELNDLPPGKVPIGSPVANTTAYVVDGVDQLCPIGVPGELLIGGAALARGYLGRAALTAASFVPILLALGVCTGLATVSGAGPMASSNTLAGWIGR